MVRTWLLSINPTSFHIRSSFSCRMLLRARGGFNVFGSSHETVCDISGYHAGFMCCTGGKSTLARSILPEGSLLVSNEIIKNRSQILAENIIKWGGDAATIVTNNDSADFTSFSHLFDIILTDVPCSGEGMFRKDANAITEWSEANVELCWKRQREIIRNIWPTLKPDGILIYSTCTYNREENEDNVMWICNELSAKVLEVSTNSEWNITGSQTEANIPVYRFLPHKTQGEGLFMAVLRKKEESNDNESDDIYNNENTKSKEKIT